MTKNGFVRVEFDLNPADGHGYETERVWAEPVVSVQFRVLNRPFFVFGVSAEDVVSATQIAEGVHKFRRVVEKGGHSTYRIFLQTGTIRDAAFQTRWTEIQQLGATFENGNGRLVCVDVPLVANLSNIRQLLERGEVDGIWAFEEANIELASGRVE